MLRKSFVVVAAALALTTAGIGSQAMREAQASECAAGEKIDNSTADTAKKKMEAAGFHQIHDLQKGCDNFWHGKADKDGVLVNVVLSPQGQAMVEGN